MCFESKYFFRMIDDILVNCWRVENDITLLKPWFEERTTKNKPNQTFQDIRNQLQKGTADDYVSEFSENYLKQLDFRTMDLQDPCIDTGLFTLQDTKMMNLTNDHKLKKNMAKEKEPSIFFSL